ncbi:MAG: hypothetical protein HN509_01360 [Halobacteriovoraceae bacterium]|jgi:TolB protein|nr:hypothetical protein [Halobacteriovoraceae bacterium]
MILKFFLIIFLSANASAQNLAIIKIGDADLEKDNIVIQNAVVSEGLDPISKKNAESLGTIIRNDFSFYKNLFNVIDPAVGPASLKTPPMYSFWQQKKIRYLVSLKVSVEPVKKGEVVKAASSIFTAELFDVRDKKSLMSIEGKLPTVEDRSTAHRISTKLFKHFTGKPSIFESKIVYVSDRTSKGTRLRKELYIMDYDGQGSRQLTRHGGTVVSPAISYDGSKIVYSLIDGNRRKKRNVNLRIFDLKSGSSKLLSSRSGMNSGAVFSPDGNSIVLTLSHTGNAEIYRMNLNSKKLTGITRHYAVDVDPNVSVSGDQMAFLSDRSGKPNIYINDPRGEEKSVKRVSFVGEFTATPRFSPDGKHIAFSAWLDNRFDIFRIDSDGDNLYRLTKDFGSNEDPTYSNDGEFIAFSSQRVLSRTSAVQNIYIMDKGGEIIGQVTKGLGNCITPRWSK